MSEANLSAKIYSLMSVLKGLTEIEILCVNNRESFESNKNHLKILSKKRKIPRCESCSKWICGTLTISRR